MIAGQGSKHRGSMEVIVDMLELMPCKKSHLMFGGRLTHQRLLDYLDILTGRNLCEFRTSEKMYYRTDKGHAFLWHAKQLESMIGPA